MHILKGQDVEQLLHGLTTQDCHVFLEILHNVLQQYSATKNAVGSQVVIHQPQRVSIVLKSGNTSLFMPSSITTMTAIKIATVGQEGIKGCINVFSPEGDLLGLLNAEQTTAFRTSLAVMIPFVRFPHKRTNILIFGAGKQAEWHIRLALLLCKDVRQITVVNRRNARGISGIFSTLQQKHPEVHFNVLLKQDPDYDAQLRSKLTTSDALFCCTPATEAHFPYSYISDGKPRFISLIGSYKPSMHEIDSDTLLSGGGLVLVDSKEDALMESGELINAGVKSDQLIEIGDRDRFNRFIEGHQRESHIFKCVGFGVMDLISAQHLLYIAKEKGIGFDIGKL